MPKFSLSFVPLTILKNKSQLNRIIHILGLSATITCGVTLIDFFFFVFYYFRAEFTAYGRSQARSQIRATAVVLRHSHSNTGSEPCLQPTPQLMATPGP